MEGQFRTRVTQLMYAAFMMLCGTVIVVRFALWGIDAIRLGETAESAFCFGLALIGLLLGALSIVVYNFNKNARLVIGSECVEIFHAHGQELTLTLDEITDVEVGAASVTLFTADASFTVNNLKNATEICDYLLKRITKKKRSVDLESERAKYKRIKKKLVWLLLGASLLLILMIAYIVICVELTGEREIEDFTATDERIFLAFIIMEAMNGAALLWLSHLAGKSNLAATYARKRIFCAEAFAHRQDALDRVPDLREVRYFGSFTYRILVWKHDERVYAYMLERFDSKSGSWINCYEKARGFANLASLYEDLSDTFDDVVFDRESLDDTEE